MAPEYPRIAHVTSNDHGPVVNVAAWILMVTAILFTLFRLVSNIYLRGRYGQHDWFIIVANAFAIGQTIATSLCVSYGLGQHQDKISKSDLESYQKSLLASSIMYIAALSANKFSLLLFISEVLAPGQTSLKRFILVAQVLIGCYLVASIFTLSFSCDFPDTYDMLGGQCIDVNAFWAFHAAADIVACLAIFILPVVIVTPLHMYMDLKAQIIFPFALEIPLCVFAIVRLIYLRRAVAAEDHTWHSVHWQVWTQISMHLGVVAANIPCLKMFLKGFESMLFRQDTTRLQATVHSNSNPDHSNDRHGRGWSGWRGKGSGTQSDRSKKRSWKVGNGSELRPGDGETMAIVGTSSSGVEIVSDGVSDKANDGAARDRIYKTTEWTVLGERS